MYKLIESLLPSPPTPPVHLGSSQVVVASYT